MELRKLSLPVALAGAVALAGCSADTVLTPNASAIGAPSALVATTDDEGVAGNYLVRFKGNSIPADFAAKVAAMGGEVIFAHSGVGIAAVAGLDDASADQLAARQDVQAVDADAYTVLEGANDAQLDAAEVTFAEPASAAKPATAFFFPRQWNMRAISAPAAWALPNGAGLGKSTTRVGILDTGIDYLSPDLYGRVDLALSKSFLPKKQQDTVQKYFPGAHEIADLNFHGTHVAATVVSNGRAAAGVTSGITLVGLKVCSPGTKPKYEGSCPTSGTLSAILYAADHGLDVINMSLGGGFTRRAASARGGDGPSFIATINRVMNYANRKGTLIVVAAGNSSWDLDHNIIPTSDTTDADGLVHVAGLYASYCDSPAVVCVSATGPTKATTANGPYENIDAFAPYSNFGRSAISVAAPGGGGDPVAKTNSYVYAVCTGFSINPGLAVCKSRFYNPRTGAWSSFVVGLQGTSMAAPHATGVAALIAGQVGHNPAQIQARLQQTADDLGEPGTDPAYGKGRVNLARAAGL